MVNLLVITIVYFAVLTAAKDVATFKQERV